MLLKEFIVFSQVDGQTALAGDLGGHFDREAVVVARSKTSFPETTSPALRSIRTLSSRVVPPASVLLNCSSSLAA